jgi:hypothetical protein
LPNFRRNAKKHVGEYSSKVSHGEKETVPATMNAYDFQGYPAHFTSHSEQQCLSSQSDNVLFCQS